MRLCRRSAIWTQVFFDIEISETGATAELLLRPNDSLTAAAVKDVRDSIKLGDELVVWGHHEQAGSSSVFLVSSIRTVNSWKDSHPHEHFVHRALRDARQPQLPGAEQGFGLYQATQNNAHPQACREELTHTETAHAPSKGEPVLPAVRLPEDAACTMQQQMLR